MSVRIICGDMIEKLSEIADESMDAIVCDPPYHLTQASRGGHARTNNPATPHGRHRIGDKGFMCKVWDGGDISMNPETWALLLRVAKPGAHLLAFSSSRTFHRVWCAVEDAGWEIRDTLLWLHGEGFPKSSNQHGEWDGWGTALKPAFEPILMARKPLIGTVAENLQQHRTGALNIDASRIETGDVLRAGTGVIPCRHDESVSRRPGETSADRSYPESGGTNFAMKPGQRGANPSGRWPANVLHDGSDEVVALFPSKAGAIAPVTRRGSDKTRNSYGAFPGQDEIGHFHGDSGSAARFFWCPKASKKDRNDGLAGMPRKAVNWSSGDKSPGSFQSPNTDRQNENHHPTVKPTVLMQYLCRLVTPRGGGDPRPFYGQRQYREGCHA